jgi:hypothetical protein
VTTVKLHAPDVMTNGHRRSIRCRPTLLSPFHTVVGETWWRRTTNLLTGPSPHLKIERAQRARCGAMRSVRELLQLLSFIGRQH